jgi:hypothetical protein
MVCKSALAIVQNAVPHSRYEHTHTQTHKLIGPETALSISIKFYDICQCVELRRAVDHPDFQSNAPYKLL